MKRPTDKERMDWLQKSRATALVFTQTLSTVHGDLDETGKRVKGRAKTLRAAIDAAMKLQRKAGK